MDQSSTSCGRNLVIDGRLGWVMRDGRGWRRTGGIQDRVWRAQSLPMAAEHGCAAVWRHAHAGIGGGGIHAGLWYIDVMTPSG